MRYHWQAVCLSIPYTEVNSVEISDAELFELFTRGKEPPCELTIPIDDWSGDTWV
ncbi:hypothetical protein FACS1894170_12020 [Planctomycetales bacterium]|nr:hypothetical protein FACS1894170_12020 [Planctomycetales bacterium]